MRIKPICIGTEGLKGWHKFRKLVGKTFSTIRACDSQLNYCDMRL